MSKLGRRRERAFIAAILVFSILISLVVIELPMASAIGWDPIEEISEDRRIEYQRYPAIASASGKAYAVWADNGDRDYDIMLREHDGLAWQVEEELNSDDNSIDQWYPDVAVEGDNVHVVWQDPVNGDWDIMYRSRSGGVLGPVEEINIDQGIETQQNPRIAVSGTHVYVVWQDGRDGDWDIYFREHDGVSWGTIEEISIDSGIEFQTLPCVAVGGGRVYVVWTDAGGGDDDIVMRVREGLSWGVIREVSQDGTNEPQGEPDISYDAGRLHIVWQGIQGTDKDIFYRSWDGSSFSSIQEISIDSGVEFQDVPSVAAEFGKVHTVWADRGDGDWDIVYRQFDGSSWLPIEDVSIDGGTENQWNPYVATDNGVVHVVWEDQGDGDQDIFYRRGFGAPPVDNEPPDVIDVLIDGQPTQTYQSSTLPATVSLTATIDDSARGNSVIGGANFTIGPGNWATSTMMIPDDFLDSSTEGFHYDVTPPLGTGTWQYCVYGWDVAGNYNTVGSCATLTIIDDLPPLVTSILIDGFPTRTIPGGTPSVTLTATLDDSTTGGSNIGGANFTSPQKDWTNSTPLIEDDVLDSPVEGFHATIDTSTLGLGSYEICAYGWDVVPNYNTDGACANLNVAVDTQPPAVTSVLINGLASFSYGISSIPVLTLTATLDDSATGNSDIGGANYTVNPQNWPSTPMIPDDVLDSSIEGFHATLDGSSFAVGTYQICVYGWDQIPNYNTIGSCADLAVDDDMEPQILNVLIDGQAVRTISEGLPSVELTATVDDTSAGSSVIGGANYTTGPAAFPGTAMNAVVPPLDSPVEDFTATVPTGMLTAGTYSLCVYGWDDIPNNNVTGSCATLNVASEIEPPEILNVLINGMQTADFGLSSVPSLMLTATLDDSSTGDSLIGGANYTIGLANWPTSTLMTPDNLLDSSVEGFHSTLTPPSTTGVWQYCVYGWDEIPNHNLTGLCATLTVHDDLPPVVSNVLLDGLSLLTVVEGTISATLTATVDDSSRGGSIIAGANYTSPFQDWSNSTLMDPDDFLDTPVEGFHSDIGISTLGPGVYEICVFGWDEGFNNNTQGSCATLVITPSGSVDLEPPMITNVLIDGASLQTFPMSSLPPSFTLTAVLDDSITGGSLIGGANYTFGPGGWPGIPMTSADSAFDEVLEDVTASVPTPAIKGTYDICVYGFDQSVNFNTTGECATLVVEDDIPPDVDDVLVDGQISLTVLPGSTVMLTGVIDDFFNGGSGIQGANYTVGIAAWPGIAMGATDGSFGESTEDVEAQIDTTGWMLGMYWLCVYGWDDIPNFNTVGVCARLVIANDIDAPIVSNVQLNGQATLTMKLSQFGQLTLTANVDDSTTGNSDILGANCSWDPPSWPDIAMASSDGQFDSPTEDVQVTVTATPVHGTYDIWVQGCDEYYNCGYGSATLIVEDDLPPSVSNVILDGQTTRTIQAGTPNVTLTALIDDSSSGDAVIGGANFTSPYLAWGNSTAMYPSTPPLDDSVEIFEVEIDTHALPAGSYEIWVYGWDSHGNLNITPMVHATLVVESNATVDNPPDVEIASIYPPEVEEGENVTVVIVASDDGTIVQVRVEVVDPDGDVVSNVTATYDEMHGGYEITLSYDEPGVYTVTAWALDDGGNWASNDDTFEVLKTPTEGQEPNHKPVLAVIFTLILLIIGFLIIWRLGVEDKLKRFWFLPFAIAEGITGGVSASTGALSIPPVAGAGLAVDLVIFLLGLSVPLLLVVRRIFSSREVEIEPDASEGDIDPENAK